MLGLVTLTAAAAAAAAAVVITTPLPGNKSATGAECQSWWCPMLLETKHSTLLFGCCKPADNKAPITGQMTRSTDSGKSWTSPIVNNHAGPAVHSETTNTIVMLVRRRTRRRRKLSELRGHLRAVKAARTTSRSTARPTPGKARPARPAWQPQATRCCSAASAPALRLRISARTGPCLPRPRRCR